MPLMAMWQQVPIMGIADGPTEVHKVTVAKQVLKDYAPDNDLFPSYHIPKLREEAQKRYAKELKEIRDHYAARRQTAEPA
jgi:acyl-CoA dehydrogenase